MINNIEEFKIAIEDHTIGAYKDGYYWFMNWNKDKGGYLWVENERQETVHKRRTKKLTKLYNTYIMLGVMNFVLSE